MDNMFFHAKSFQRKLCGAAWVNSKASTIAMFTGSSGSISRVVCKSAATRATTLATHQYASRRPIPERELIVRTPITTSVSKSVITPTIANTMPCQKCGRFKKSGRVSCCAPGGAWFQNCGGAGNRNVDHRWFDGVEACKRTSEVGVCRLICLLTQQHKN